MESTGYGDNPIGIRWYRTVFGGKQDELSLEEAFDLADDTTIFVVPESMLEAFQGMVFILGKRVGIWVKKEETPPFEFNNYSSIEAIYPYSLSFLRRRQDGSNITFRPEKSQQLADISKWRAHGKIL